MSRRTPGISTQDSYKLMTHSIELLEEGQKYANHFPLRRILLGITRILTIVGLFFVLGSNFMWTAIIPIAYALIECISIYYHLQTNKYSIELASKLVPKSIHDNMSDENEENHPVYA